MTKELIATPCFKCSNLTAVRCSKCKTTAVKKANLKDTLVFTFRDDFLNDGSPPNMCIQKIYKGKNNYPWCGPVLVLKLKGLNVSNNEYTDMTPKDFEDVVDYFCWYGKSEESRFESTIEEVKFG